jgi:NAD(P)-dependent dehydrogenase (short-subunit alcohol dehydrogenase family)
MIAAKGGGMRLKDKVAIITGAGSGTGRAGALIFAREGARVVVADLDPENGEETARMVQGSGGQASFIQVDCGRVEDMRRLVEQAVQRYGRLDILWNHAGIPGPGTLETTEEADFDRAMAVNIKGGFFATKFAVPHLKEAGGGSIIFTASISALRASPWSPSYSLAKGGLIPLTMSLAVYLGTHNIRVNCICPAGIDTPMLRVFIDRGGKLKGGDLENAVKDLSGKSPVGRLATAEDVANVALFLASDESAYLNGVAIPVDGGKSARC